MSRRSEFVACGLLLLGCIGCSAEDTPPETSDAEYRAKIVANMHDTLLAEIQTLRSSAESLRDAAPIAPGRGWDAALDANQIESLMSSWKTARSAYERGEGAIAPLFPDSDYAIDARYDDFLVDLGSAGDPDAFDGQGVTGMHAIERVLWAHDTPSSVMQFESALPGYRAAAWPATEPEASEFQSGLCQQLVDDVNTLENAWKPSEIHINIAFQGLTSLMNEQREKVVKAASDEEESRYSQRTMSDIRDNLEGTQAVYALFQPYLRSKANGAAIDEGILQGFARLASAYAKVDGDQFPLPPASWSSEDPSPADLATPFGELYQSVNAAVDPNAESSIVAQMNQAAALLGLGIL